MSSFDPSSPSPSKSRRRIVAWLAFGAVGLATGAVWASGFAFATGGNDATEPSPAITKTAPSVATSALADKVTQVDDLEFDWEGRWGSIEADIVTFKVNLSTLPADRDYNVALLLANASVFTGWATVQLEFEQRVSVAGDCTDVDFDGTGGTALLLNSDNQDAGVYWNALDGGAVYCLGVASSDGDDELGTFLRASQDTPPLASGLKFIATVDRTL